MTPPRAEPELIDRIAGRFAAPPPDPLGVAVSGGGDSLALLVLLDRWRHAGGPGLRAVTVDHRLRPESAAEAATVARFCAARGLPHATLTWDGGDDGEPRGNLQDRARRARYALMARWAHEAGVAAIALAHTADDQAETFLMRLAREAGVDGLSAMARRWVQGGVTFTRPVLDVTREELRAVLRARGLAWVDDPANADATYERVRARQVLAALGPLGIGAPTLSAVAGHLAEARDGLTAQMAQAARRIARIEAGDVVVGRAGLAALPAETARRLLREALMWISGADYPPRGRTLSAALDRVAAGKGMTLHGCRLIPRADTLRITREAQAVAGHFVSPGAVWDGRWRVTGPAAAEARIGPLGAAGLRQCPDRGASPLPAASLRASPAVWQDETLLAAPLAGLRRGWRAELVARDRHDFAALIAH